MEKHSSLFQNLSILAIFCLVAVNSYSQKIATLEVKLSKATFGLDIPVSINLDEVTYVTDSLLNLLEIKGNNRTAIPFQIEQGDPRRLFWIVKTEAGSAAGKHTFELVKGKTIQSPEVVATANDGALTIRKGAQNLLQYNFKTVYPPKGIDTAYKRSGFIHPLWSPHGQVLTRIQAPDHYHHYGIWNPWTHVLFEGDTIDFWNLRSKQGTVRFANFVKVENGSVFSEFGALHEHVVLKKGGGEKVAMNELHSVRVYRPQENRDFYVVDFNFQMNPAGESPFKILEYRYAGFGWRTTEKWDQKNSMFLTSEGKTRKDADGTKARWCIVQGEIDNDYAGVVMMSSPTNYNFPEPMRIWPESPKDRGDLFASFCPTKDKDWLLKPSQVYMLKYRMLVYNGHMDKDKAESAWQYFAYPPKVTFKLEK
jgi:hypothetical protein